MLNLQSHRFMWRTSSSPYPPIAWFFNFVWFFAWLYLKQYKPNSVSAVSQSSSESNEAECLRIQHFAQETYAKPMRQGNNN